MTRLKFRVGIPCFSTPTKNFELTLCLLYKVRAKSLWHGDINCVPEAVVPDAQATRPISTPFLENDELEALISHSWRL
jgi:hypothetical protein